MKSFCNKMLKPYIWLENWNIASNGKLLIKRIGIYCLLMICCNKKWEFPYFYLFCISFTFLLIAAVIVESIYMKQINKIRTLTANKTGFYRANLLYTRFEQTNWTGIIAILIVVIFGGGGLLMFGAIVISPTLILCLIYFSVTVYLSIVGYVQYIQLFIYITNLGMDNQKYRNTSDELMDNLPAEVDWLKDLTKLSHFYRTIFFTVGAFYIIAFGFYCSAPGFMALSNHYAYFILWGIIFLAIVVTFPIVSIIEFYQIKRIVKKIKLSYIQEVKISLMGSNSRRTAIEKRVLNQLFSTSILTSQDYPIKNNIGIAYAFVLSLLNIAGSIDTIIQLGEKFLV